MKCARSFKIAGLFGLILIHACQKKAHHTDNGDHRPAFSFSAPVTLNGTPSTMANDGDFAAVTIPNVGIQILSIKIPELPLPVGELSWTGDIASLTMKDSFVYAYDKDEGLLTIDIGNPTEPRLASKFSLDELEDYIHTIVYAPVHDKRWIYLAGHLKGIMAVDVTNPQTPFKVDFDLAQNTYFTNTLSSYGGNVIASEYTYGITIHKENDDQTLEKISSINIDGHVNKIKVENTNLYLSNLDHGFEIIDISDVNNPQRIATYPTSTLLRDFILFDHRALLLTYNDSSSYQLTMIDFTDSTHIIPLHTANFPGNLVSLQQKDDLVYVLDSVQGLMTLSLGDLP